MNQRFIRANYPYLIAILALLLGGSYYLFCRNPLITLLQWLIPRILQPVLAHLRGVTLPLCAYLPIGVQDAIPDGLWSLAYATLITHLWLGHGGWSAGLWLSTIPLVCIGYEVLQIGGVIPGVFSWIDLYFSLLGMTMGFLFVKFHRPKERLLK